MVEKGARCVEYSRRMAKRNRMSTTLLFVQAAISPSFGP
jgi:hypothetical protein